MIEHNHADITNRFKVYLIDRTTPAMDVLAMGVAVSEYRLHHEFSRDVMIAKVHHSDYPEVPRGSQADIVDMTQTAILASERRYTSSAEIDAGKMAAVT